MPTKTRTSRSMFLLVPSVSATASLSIATRLIEKIRLSTRLRNFQIARHTRFMVFLIDQASILERQRSKMLISHYFLDRPAAEMEAVPRRPDRAAEGRSKGG